MTKWYDQPLELKPSDTIQTPLGKLTVTVEGNYTVYAQLTEFVTINRIQCRVCVTSILRLSAEEWHHSFSVDRIQPSQTPHSSSPWTVTGSATDSARKKAREAVLPLLEKWIDEHFHEIEQGRLVAERNLIQRAHHRLDDAIKEIEQRRAELKAMSEYLDQHGTLKDSDRSLLADLWSWHWRF